VEGVGEGTALFLKVVAETIARYRYGMVKDSDLLTDRSAMEMYLTSLFIGSKAEKVFVILFGADGRMLQSVCVAEGFACCAQIPVGKVLQLATATGACTVVLAHNHPEGSSKPSQTDVESTRRLAVTLAQIGVKLHDHVVVAGDCCHSVFDYMKDEMNQNA
jgi:DNA repair protein RadC